MAAKKSRKRATKKPAAKKPVGRPRSEMTDEAVERILRLVRIGVYPDSAAAGIGVKPATMRSHKKRHPEFATAIEKAEAEAEGSVHSRVLRHMRKNWQAAAWMLERRWPERYAKPEVRAQMGAAAGAGTDEIVRGIHAFLVEAEARNVPEGAKDVDAEDAPAEKEVDES